MANRTRQLEKNREKVVQDRLQLLLTRLLQDEDNKYCVDCDSKGPRWASWNIGVFLCIRCAGIHRNLGVHISKVKSVNLDSWTPQQVASMQLMGNSKGRAVYEAGLAEDHRRPQSDQALETFIRAKYEKKKYVAREWTPSKPPDLPLGWAELIEAEKQKKDIRGIVLPSRIATSLPISKPDNKTIPASNDEVPAKQKEADAVATKKDDVKSSASADLLGLMTNGTEVDAATPAAPLPSASLSSQLDLLCLGGGPPASVGAVASGGSGAVADKGAEFSDFVGASSVAAASLVEPPAATAVARNDIGDLDFGAAFSPSSGPAGATASTTTGSSQMSKDSIMALFNKPPIQSPQMLPGANPPRPQMPASFGGQSVGGGGGFNLQQHSLGINLMNPQAQLGQFGTLAQPAMPSAQSPNNPFSLHAQTDLALGTMSAANGSTANSQSWGFAQ